MKILLITQNLGKDYSSISYSFLDAFKALGNCEVELFDFPILTDWNLLERAIKKIIITKKIFIENFNKKLFIEVKNFKPNLIVVLKGTYLMPETIERIKNSTEVKIVCFNPDDPFNKASSNKLILNSIKHYHSYFIWSNKLKDRISSTYNIPAYYLPFAVDPKLFYKPGENIPYLYDATFIGNGDEERVNALDKISFYLRSKKYKYNFNVFGANYYKTYENIKIFPQANGIRFLETVASSKININILRLQNKNSTNMRTFEIPAVGGFMLHEYSEEAMEFFKPGIAAEYFKDFEECADKIKYYLDNPSKREKIAIKGYENTKKNGYDYHSRVKTIINLV